MIKGLQQIPLYILRKTTGYFGLAILFFALSFVTLYSIHHYFSAGRLQIPSSLLSPGVLSILAIILILYFLADGLRLYCVIRAMGFRIAFVYIMKLVFINIFISNVTPLATGGGVIQVYFMKQQGIPLGEATAATSIRTILAALILFTLTPLIIWIGPNQFRMFFHPSILYAVTGVSCMYLAFFWIILCRIRILKRWMYRSLYLLNSIKMLSQPRFRKWFLKISLELDLFSNGFKRYFRNSPQWAILSVLFTVLFLLFLFSFSIVLIRALGYQSSIVTVLGFQVVVTFFMYFAPTPGATGVAEGGYGLLFAQLVQKQDIALLTLSWRVLTIYIGVVIGIVLMYRELFQRGKAIQQ
ncbi:lysylphosphatidylglycerol synthase transmembrane domain-containing protein [Desulfogranum japonicum]|uniref:lysylphosphatidylglycerol synthase transmembrane domain-containing protein n=1 Tax=Desulfogranum japonicum TaxID=231447 RepID=UPI00041A8C00|nr:lysylphosphatidylglycerol synthase transmembrane domain-containing protein [Desulfogranum japonicum]